MGHRKKQANRGETYRLVQLPRADEDDEYDGLEGGDFCVGSKEQEPVETVLVPETTLRSHTYRPEKVNVRRKREAFYPSDKYFFDEEEQEGVEEEGERAINDQEEGRVEGNRRMGDGVYAPFQDKVHQRNEGTSHINGGGKEEVGGDTLDEKRLEGRPHHEKRGLEDSGTTVRGAAPHTQTNRPFLSGTSSNDHHLSGAAMTKRKEDEEEEEPLFDGAMEGGVTDDFLRQLVLGVGGSQGGGKDPHRRVTGRDKGKHPTGMVQNKNEEEEDFYDEEMEDDEEWDWSEEVEEADSNEEARKAALGEEEIGSALPPGMDGEVWRLLSQEEREGVLLATSAHGWPRMSGMLHPLDTRGRAGEVEEGEPTYPKHQDNTRLIDRQFAEMMNEFNVDAAINDPDNTSDPRTQGPLSVHQYLPALQEFVAERAGLNFETAELAKNKGLMQQLRLLEHREGAFDMDVRDGGIYMPAVQSQKQAQFAEAFAVETERIRAAAAARVRKAEGLSSTENIAAVSIEENGVEAEKTIRTSLSPSAPSSNDVDAEKGKGQHEESKENEPPMGIPPTTDAEDNDSLMGARSEEECKVITVAPREKRGRLDCETVVSTYSTYYNRPNVIRPPPRHRPSPPAGASSIKTSMKSTAFAEHRISNSSSDKRGDSPVKDVDNSSRSGGRCTSSTSSNGSLPHGKDVMPFSPSFAPRGAKTVKPHVDTAYGAAPRKSRDNDPDRPAVGCSLLDGISLTRRKGESKEEKELRKSAVKELQRQRRMEKSALKNAYKAVESEEIKKASMSTVAKKTVHFF